MGGYLQKQDGGNLEKEDEWISREEKMMDINRRKIGGYLEYGDGWICGERRWGISREGGWVNI